MSAKGSQAPSALLSGVSGLVDASGKVVRDGLERVARSDYVLLYFSAH